MSPDLNDDVKKLLQGIELVITDVDGVLTDGGMYYTESGDELKKFDVRDGTGTIMLRLAGIKFGAMTGEKSPTVERRMKKLKADFAYVGVRDKRRCLQKVLNDYGVSKNEVAFVGDEINDYPLLGEVGVFFAAADSTPEVLAKADVVLETRGGGGVLKEVARLILEARGRKEEMFEAFLERIRGLEDSDNPLGKNVLEGFSPS